MSQEQRVVDYFKYCDEDYKWLWRNNRNLATHLGFWDEKTKSHSQSLINQNIMMAKLANINSKDVILDAGCGVGGSAFWLANKFQTKIHAINISKNQLNLAKEYAKKIDKNRFVSFSLMNYYKTNFPSKSFSVIWAQESIPHADNKRKFLEEAFRLLKDGGRLVTSDYFLAKNNYNENEKKILTKWMDSWAMKNFIQPKEFIKLAKKVGFRKVKYVDTTKLIDKSLKKLKMTSYYCYPIGLILEIFHLRNRYQQENMRSPLYCDKAYRMDLWKHGLVYAEK